MESAHLSPAAAERLREELAERSGPRRLMITDRIEKARELGDLKENADYHAAKDEQGLNEARIRQIEAILRDAVIVESASGDQAAPGTIVELRFVGSDDTMTYLLGSIEERRDDLDVLSTSSPLGKAVLDNPTPGEVFDYTTPIHVVASYEDGAFVLRPVGLPGIEVRRELDADGHMVWTRPDMGGIRVVLERVSEPR